MSGSSHRFGAPVLGSYEEETRPWTDWRNAETDRKDAKAWTSLLRSEHSGLSWARRIEIFISEGWVSHDHLAVPARTSGVG